MIILSSNLAEIYNNIIYIDKADSGSDLYKTVKTIYFNIQFGRQGSLSYFSEYTNDDIYELSVSDFTECLLSLNEKGYLPDDNMDNIQAINMIYDNQDITIVKSVPLNNILKNLYCIEAKISVIDTESENFKQYRISKIGKLQELFHKTDIDIENTGIPSHMEKLVSDYLADDEDIKASNSDNNNELLEQLKARHDIDPKVMGCLTVDLLKYPYNIDGGLKKDFVSKKDIIDFAYNIDKKLGYIEESLLKPSYEERKNKTLDKVIETLDFKDSIKRFQKVRKYRIPKKLLPLLSTYLLSDEYTLDYRLKIRRRNYDNDYYQCRARFIKNFTVVMEEYYLEREEGSTIEDAFKQELEELKYKIESDANSCYALESCYDSINDKAKEILSDLKPQYLSPPIYPVSPNEFYDSMDINNDLTDSQTDSKTPIKKLISQLSLEEREQVLDIYKEELPSIIENTLADTIINFVEQNAKL